MAPQLNKLAFPKYSESFSGWIAPDGTRYETPYHWQKGLEIIRANPVLSKQYDAMRVNEPLNTNVYDILFSNGYIRIVHKNGVIIDYQSNTGANSALIEYLASLPKDAYVEIHDINEPNIKSLLEGKVDEVMDALNSTSSMHTDAAKLETGADVTFKLSKRKFGSTYIYTIEAYIDDVMVGELDFEYEGIKAHKNIYIGSTSVIPQFQNMGIGKLMNEYLVSYMNGKYGMTNYTIHSEPISQGGWRMHKYRDELMFDPSKNTTHKDSSMDTLAFDKFTTKTKTGLDVELKLEEDEYESKWLTIVAYINDKRVGELAFSLYRSGRVHVESTDVKAKYRKQGIGALMQEYFISYLNGKYGMGNYTIETETTTEGGEKMFDERSKLMFNPENNMQDYTGSDTTVITNISKELAKKITQELRDNGVAARYDDAINNDQYGDLFDVFVDNRVEWQKAHTLLESKFASLTHTAASPNYMREYTFDEFKKVAHPGQIWQTSLVLMRIDKLTSNKLMRRMSRYLKFYGAFTGIGPRAMKALLPNKSGKLPASAGPWSVSRKFEPFLLLKEGVFEYTPENDNTGQLAQNPDMTTPEPEYEPLELNLDELEPNLRANLDSSISLSALEPITADVVNDELRIDVQEVMGKCKVAYDALVGIFDDHHYRSRRKHSIHLAFNVKMNVNVPAEVYEQLSEQAIADIYDFVVQQEAEQFVEGEALSEYPWIGKCGFDGRSGGWFIAEIGDRSALFNRHSYSFDPDENFDTFIDDAYNWDGGDLEEDMGEAYAENKEHLISVLNQIQLDLTHAYEQVSAFCTYIETAHRNLEKWLGSMDFWKEEIANHTERTTEASLKNDITFTQELTLE